MDPEVSISCLQESAAGPHPDVVRVKLLFMYSEELSAPPKSEAEGPALTVCSRLLAQHINTSPYWEADSRSAGQEIPRFFVKSEGWLSCSQEPTQMHPILNHIGLYPNHTLTPY
jgi:hypothetical protein